MTKYYFYIKIFTKVMIFALKPQMDSPYKNKNSVSGVFTIKCPVCGLTCLMFVVSSTCLYRVGYIHITCNCYSRSKIKPLTFYIVAVVVKICYSKI